MPLELSEVLSVDQEWTEIGKGARLLVMRWDSPPMQQHQALLNKKYPSPKDAETVQRRMRIFSIRDWSGLEMNKEEFGCTPEHKKQLFSGTQYDWMLRAAFEKSIQLMQLHAEEMEDDLGNLPPSSDSGSDLTMNKSDGLSN